MRLYEHEQRIRTILRQARVESPGLRARMLLAHVCGLDDVSYILGANDEVDARSEELLANLIPRCAAGEPMAYILGRKEFYSHDFLVTKDTLVPRPETELLVDAALRYCQKPAPIMADIGCGSGCIGISILAARPAWQGILLDISAQALETACRNMKMFALSANIIQANIFCLPFSAASVDVLVSNPPYIGFGEKPAVMREVLEYEPHKALFSEENGLAHLRSIISQARNILRPQGQIILEHGAGQSVAVTDMLAAAGFKNIRDIRDLAGLPRCAIGNKE